MRINQKHFQPVSWFRLGLIGIFLVSLILRFWGLERFNALVFDEVYYAKFANNYLTKTPFFDGHPPLSKYLIAIGIWIGNRLPIAQNTVNSLTGSSLSTWSYRWLNALTGSVIPLVVSAIAWSLSQRRSYTLIAGAFAAMDGLFLVESRYALNNVYLVLFGLLGQWFLLLSLKPNSISYRFLALSGVFFAASASIKWNGLWFLFGAYLLWGLAWSFRVISNLQQSAKRDLQIEETRFPTSPLYSLTQINPIRLLLCFAVIPAVFYGLIWIPHLQLNPEFNFFEVQRQILAYHQRVGNGANIHPYCSTWYSWLLMIRPVAYYYQVFDSATLGNFIVSSSTGKIIYDVHAIGNPFLWWFSTIAVFFMAWVLIEHYAVIPKLASKRPVWSSYVPTRSLWIGLFLMVNYLANLLPWVPVSRCVFLYHYMGASVFASMMLAWFVDRWFQRREFRVVAAWIMLIVAGGFIFWMPIYLGLPLTPAEYNLRMWFNSWI